MSRRHVYGKRSRAIYDPLAAFGSPQNTPPNNSQSANDIKAVGESCGLVDQKPKLNKRSNGRRKALAEINSNATVNGDTAIIQKTKTQQRRRRKIVVEDDEVEEEGLTEKIDGARRKNIRRPQGNGLSDRFWNQRHDSINHEINGVPLFSGQHDYESEDEDRVALQHESPSNCDDDNERNQDLQQGPEPGMPSINILSPTPPQLDEYSEHCASLLQLASHPMTEFSDWSKQLANHFDITKIAEASFGEVYRLSLRQPLPEFSSSNESVFKIIALRPPNSIFPPEQGKCEATKPKADSMSRSEDVTNEVRLLQRMSTIPGFTNFRDVRVIKGRPPQPFVKAFKAFNASQKARKKDPSNFPDPAKKASYPDDQLWAVIEMQDAGTDLECLVEHGQCTSIWFVWDVFWQVVLSLAKGEEGAEFEHRDLHLGNICVRQHLDSKIAIDTKRKLNFTGLETTIIDYTISRAAMPDRTIAYQDLARGSGLFEGDSTEEYQYDIYRYMRGALFLDDPYAEFSQTLEDNERSWEQYHPITNLIWLHFILYKLLEQVDWPSATKAPPRKQKAEHAKWKRANDLEHVLLRVQELLYPDAVCTNETRSASDLVGLALSEGWIDAGDVMGEGSNDYEDVGDALAERLEELSLQSQPVQEALEAINPTSTTVTKTRTLRHRV